MCYTLAKGGFGAAHGALRRVEEGSENVGSTISERIASIRHFHSVNKHFYTLYSVNETLIDAI